MQQRVGSLEGLGLASGMERARFFVTPADRVVGNCHVHAADSRWPYYCRANDGLNCRAEGDVSRGDHMSIG